MFNIWKRKKKAIDIDALRKKAKENDVDAQIELSLAYYKGTGVVKDMQKSSYWFRKAHEGCR